MIFDILYHLIQFGDFNLSFFVYVSVVFISHFGYEFLFDSWCTSWISNMPQIYFRFKGSQLRAFCPLAIVHCYLEFKLCYFQSLKLFSIRVKELFKPIILEKRQRVFALLKRIFLRNRPLSEAQELRSKMHNWEEKFLSNWTTIK